MRASNGARNVLGKLLLPAGMSPQGTRPQPREGCEPPRQPWKPGGQSRAWHAVRGHRGTSGNGESCAQLGGLAHRDLGGSSILTTLQPCLGLGALQALPYVCVCCHEGEWNRAGSTSPGKHQALSLSALQAVTHPGCCGRPQLPKTPGLARAPNLPRPIRLRQGGRAILMWLMS